MKKYRINFCSFSSIDYNENEKKKQKQKLEKFQCRKVIKIFFFLFCLYVHVCFFHYYYIKDISVSAAGRIVLIAYDLLGFPRIFLFVCVCTFQHGCPCPSFVIKQTAGFESTECFPCCDLIAFDHI